MIFYLAEAVSDESLDVMFGLSVWITNLNLFYYLRGYKLFSLFVNILSQTIHDMITFFIILIVMVTFFIILKFPKKQKKRQDSNLYMCAKAHIPRRRKEVKNARERLFCVL